MRAILLLALVGQLADVSRPEDPWIEFPKGPGGRRHFVMLGMFARWTHERAGLPIDPREPGTICVAHHDIHADQDQPMSICCPESWGSECCERMAHEGPNAKCGGDAGIPVS